MNNLSNIKFYNSKGFLVNSRIEEDTMYVYINMDTTSVGLVQSQTIYVLEDVYNGGTNVLSKPKLKSDNTISLIDNEFSLFKVDNDLKEIITSFDHQTLISDNFDDSVETFVGGKRQELLPVPTPIVLNVMFRSNEDGNYTADLTLTNNEYKIVIVLYCESEGTDDRLITLLSRFGENITKNEEIIFRESDISDDIQSSIILNQKRKDLLNNISSLPYLSSIKGLEFIIEFFGYSDIMTVKEFYYDTDNDKIIMFEHDDTKSNRTNYQKLSNFGLFYQLNKIVDDSFDEFNNPNTEDVFTIPIEDIIIKLFALKNYISSRQIGGVSRIIDIIGERINFRSYRIQNWNKHVEYVSVDKQVYPELELSDFTKYIIDLRTLNIGVCHLDPDDDLNPLQIGTIQNCYVGYFSNYYQTELTLFDEPNIDIGAVAVLRNSTFDISWNEADVSWFVENQPITITWLNIGGLYYHTTRFKIYKDGFSKTIEIDNLSGDSIEIILPYIGKYNVTLTLIGYNNLISKRTFYDYFEVKQKEVEFTQFFRYHDKNLQVFETNNMSFDILYNDWNSVIYDNGEFNIDNGEVNFKTYELINFITHKNKRGFGELNWEEYNDDSWINLEYLSWRDTQYNTKKLAIGIIDNFVLGETIQINNFEYTIPLTHNVSNYAGLANILNNFTDDYTFTHKKDYLNNDFIEFVSPFDGLDTNFYVGTNGNTGIESNINLCSWDKFINVNFSSWGDMVVSWDNTNKLYRSDVVEEEFNIDNIRYYTNEMVCPTFVPIFFTTDNSKIVGKTNATYNFYDINNNIIDTIDGLNVCKRFENSGIYTVECIITDTNGNQTKIIKQKIIKILKHNEFRLYK